LSGGFDVVHAHVSTVSPLAVTSAVRAARAGIPTVVTVHSLWKNLGWLYRPIERIFAIGDLPIVWASVSRVAAEHVRPIVGVTHPVTVVPNAVAADDWHVHGVPHAADKVVLVSVGRLAARKRPRHLLRILRDVRRRVPSHIELDAVLLGDGPQRRLLQVLLRRYGLAGWVRLPGHVSHDQLRTTFAQADVYIAPATLESFGIAALEARCAGLPIVARECSGIADFVTDGVEGCLAHDDAHMTSLIERLAEDPLLRARMSAHNRAHRPPMRWSDVLDACQRLYAEANRLAGRDEFVETGA
jgi:glycosyltransferase involved in cell wall biosynthesis